MRTALLAALIGLALLALPASDAGAQGHVEGPPLFQFQFKSSGDLVRASAQDRTVILEVARIEEAKQRRAESAYVVHGHAERGVRAVLPGIGRIALRFHPTGPWREIFGCFSGRAPERRPGVFAGNFNFVGEHRYLVAHRRRIPGTELAVRPCTSPPGGPIRREGRRASSAPRLSLPSIELSPGKRGPGTRVQARFRSGPLARSFSAEEGSQGGGLELFATEEDVVGGLGTYRIVSAAAPEADLSVDRRVSTASVRGAAPFGGSATMTRAANGTRSWTGDLTASFLGDPDVPMTGPEYETRLSHGF